MLRTVTDTELHQGGRAKHTLSPENATACLRKHNSVWGGPKWHQETSCSKVFVPWGQISCTLIALTIRWKSQKGQSFKKKTKHWGSMWWQPEGKGLGVGGGGQRRGTGNGKRLCLGQWAPNAVRGWCFANCTPETGMVLWTNITLANSIKTFLHK